MNKGLRNRIADTQGQIIFQTLAEAEDFVEMKLEWSDDKIRRGKERIHVGVPLGVLIVEPGSLFRRGSDICVYYLET